MPDNFNTAQNVQSGLATGMAIPNRNTGMAEMIKSITNDLRAAASSRQEQAQEFRKQNIDLFKTALDKNYRLKPGASAEDFLTTGDLSVFSPPPSIAETLNSLKEAGLGGGQGSGMMGTQSFGEPTINYDIGSGKTGLSWKPSSPDPKAFERLGDALDPTKTVRSPLGIAKIAYDKAERIESLAAAFADGNLDSRQIEELAIGFNSLLQGSSGSGGSSERLISGLIPRSFIGDVQKIKEFLLNKPQGMKQQEFVRRMMGTVEREKATTAAQIKRVQFSRLAQFKNLEKKDPEQFYQVLMSWGIDPEEYQAWKDSGYKQINAGTAGLSGANSFLQGNQGWVKMRRPDGTIKEVAAQSVQEALASGYQPVGGQ